MQATPPSSTLRQRPARPRLAACWFVALAGVVDGAGCAAWQPAAQRPAGGAPNATADENPFLPLRPDAAAPLAASASNPTQLPQIAELSVLYLRVPRLRLAQVEKIWTLLREDIVDSETALSLRRNGLHVGIGHANEWEAVKAIFDAAPECAVNDAAPLRMPEGFPLDLQLSNEPRDQTIFCVERDGILSGADLAASRNALRVIYGPEPRDAGRARLTIMPCVLQDRLGMRWVRTAEGVAQVPEHGGRMYLSASFSAALGAGEFLVIAAGPDANVPGIVGRAMLTDEGPEGEFYNYVFLRPALIDARKQ